MHVDSGQFATVEVIDSQSTIQFVAKGYSILTDEVVVTYTSPVIIVSEDGYTSDVKKDNSMQPWGGVLVAISVMLLLMIAGIGYYVVRGRSIKADITRKPDYSSVTYI